MKVLSLRRWSDWYTMEANQRMPAMTALLLLAVGASPT